MKVTDTNPREGSNHQSLPLPDLSEIVRGAMPNLAAAATTLAECGLERHATILREVLCEMQKSGVPAPGTGRGPDHFVVQATFLVSRAALYEMLAEVACGNGSWYRITEAVQPVSGEPKWAEDRSAYFRCPLAGGGALLISTTGPEEKAYRLDLFSVSLGLEVMAGKYPRHFASLLNGEDGPQTADVFLQCCLFGTILHNPLSAR